MRTPAPFTYPGIDSTPVPGGWRIAEVDDHYIEVIQMSSCTRIVEQIIGFPRLTWDRYWCYYGPHQLITAMLAASAWVHLPDPEPAGWDLAWDGRRQ